MGRNNSIQVFRGGWPELENAVFTDNEETIANSGSFFIKPDGTQLFVMNITTDIVETYPLSIPYDVTTKGSLGNTFPIPPSDDGVPFGLFFKDDGTKMFVVGVVSSSMLEYTLPTPWDVSSIVSAAVSLVLASVLNSLLQCAFSRDGDFFFVTDDDRILSYALPTPWDITSASTTATAIFASGTVTSIAFKREGDRMYLGSTTNIREFALSTVNDITTTTLTATLPTTMMINDILFRSNGQEFFISDVATDDITRFHTNQDWEIIDASHFTNLFALDNTVTNRAVNWKPDGTEFFILGNGPTDTIKAYSAVKPWNQTGATLIGTFDTTPITANAESMWWIKDGTICYIIANTEIITQLDASTPWDVTTLTNSGVTFQASQANPAKGLFFRDDGLKFYVSGNSVPGSISEYNMTTPNDLSTASFVQTFNFSTSLCNGCFFSSDGIFLYRVDPINDEIEMYILSTPWDISTAVNTNAPLDVSAQDTNPFGMFIRQDNGKKLYFTGTANDNLNSYDLSKEFDNTLITELGDDLVTDSGDTLVYS